MNFGDKEFSEKKSEESKWFFKTGAEYIRYQSTFPAFDGLQEKFEETE